MNNRIPLGQVFGIRIWLSRFLLWMIAGIPLLAALRDPSAFWPTAFFLGAVLICVLVHELGHSRVAMHFGVNVSHITLSPLGGAAWMEEVPEDPKIEALIAIAGPAVNVGLALVAAPLLLIVGGEASLAAGIVESFIGINLALGLFNLLPAFPMDGGRLLRSWLATKCDWLEATEKAVRIGRSVALAAAIIGFMKGFFLVPIIALYVWLMGQKELFVMRAKKLGGGGFSFANFGQAGGNPFARATGGAREPEQELESDSFQSEDEVPARHSSPARGGFTDEDIRKLEGFRGRLSRDWKDEE